MCLYPIFIKNKKYLPNKKNGGFPPACEDYRTRFIPAECGECYECRKKKQREWCVRMLEELKENPNAYFWSLTIDDKNFNKLKKEAKCKDVNIIAKLAVRRLLERCRKLTGKSIKHWFITELGHENTKRLHLHGFTWGIATRNVIAECWKYGFVYCGDYVNSRTVFYVTKYMLKKDKKNADFKGKVFASAGIGANFYNKNDAYEKQLNHDGSFKDYYRLQDGRKIALPKYFKNKILSEDERERLWIKKLDKGEKWVMGEKCTTEEEYMKALEYHAARCREIHGDKARESKKLASIPDVSPINGRGSDENCESDLFNIEECLLYSDNYVPF
ncbi:replication initiator protein [Peromfec virus RodF8_19]|uniref:Replication initiator protein n=1 Tax=Peromfec virus RodF8_19 TaxID=2929361 RepID=A0A976R7S0_9VIRU|nr:replication initiator protein [Peromfec virus RodF8_19]